MLADLDVTADRERIARDLHQIVVTRLHAVRELVERARSEPDADALLADAVRTLDETELDIRDAVLDWQRPATSAPSLLVDLQEVVDDYTPLLRFTPTVHLVGSVEEIPPEVEDQLCPVLREALSNLARHSAALHGEIELRADGDEVRLTVVDDGVGPGRPTLERGLRHARRRAEALDGSLEVVDAQPRGTAFVWRVPLTR